MGRPGNVEIRKLGNFKITLPETNLICFTKYSLEN